MWVNKHYLRKMVEENYFIISCLVINIILVLVLTNRSIKNEACLFLTASQWRKRIKISPHGPEWMLSHAYCTPTNLVFLWTRKSLPDNQSRQVKQFVYGPGHIIGVWRFCANKVADVVPPNLGPLSMERIQDGGGWDLPGQIKTCLALIPFMTCLVKLDNIHDIISWRIPKNRIFTTHSHPPQQIPNHLQTTAAEIMKQPGHESCTPNELITNPLIRRAPKK